jgi:hypothetical protein
MREGRVSIRSTGVVAHVVAYRAVARRKLIKSTRNKWCRSGIIFLCSLIVSLLAFSPKTQSGHKDKKTPTPSAIKLPGVFFLSRARKRSEKIKNKWNQIFRYEEKKHKNDNEHHNGNKLARYKDLSFWCLCFRNTPVDTRKREHKKRYENLVTVTAEVKNACSHTSSAR